MNINEAFPSKYLKAGDFPQPRQMFMTQVGMEEMGNPKENKPVLYFQGEKKGMVMNITRKDVITGRYGPQTEGWAGQPIWLLGGMTLAFGEQTATIIVTVDPPQVMQPGPQTDTYRQYQEEQQPGPPAPLNNPPGHGGNPNEVAQEMASPAQLYPDGSPYPGNN